MINDDMREIPMHIRKGDLKMCDKWREIALLSVAGKSVTRVTIVLQQLLLRIIEVELTESQCGFRLYL